MARIVSNGLVFALAAGLFAALASVFAKIAFDSNYIPQYICGKDYEDNTVRPLAVEHLESKPMLIMDLFKCKTVAYTIRVLSAIMIILCNILMFRSFSKSLLLCSSTAEATVTNTAANFCVSGIFGWTLFNERFSQTWLIGTCLIITGLAVVHSSREVAEEGAHAHKTD